MTTRLYINFDESCKVINLPEDECHYLLRVLRLKQGDIILVYNEHVGEWQAELFNVKKISCSVMLRLQLRKPTVERIRGLVYAPLKHDAMRFLYEKATELGVTHFQPMVTDYAQKYAFHPDKIWRQLKQASQQCERLSIPQLLPIRRLDDILHDFSQDDCCYNLFAAIERSNENGMLGVCRKMNLRRPTNCLIGPEGGFSERETELIRSTRTVKCVTLGENVLRSETAAIVLLSVVYMIAKS